MAVYTYLDASTAHADQDDLARLHQATARTNHLVHGLIVYPYDKGFFIIVPGRDDVASNLSQLKEAGFSLPLRRLLAYASRQGCQLLRLDADGDEIEGLNINAW